MKKIITTVIVRMRDEKGASDEMYSLMRESR